MTAAALVIGNEILSGRTVDANVSYLGRRLNELGIQLKEVRVVADDVAAIVEAVNALRRVHDYLFTTGGIGPTHDDITADAVAAAFAVGIDHHPDAMAQMAARYRQTGMEFNEARKRMARVPDGATLIENPISTAPGFRIENVFVLAGVPVV
ncbi:MAG: competence/damage-inducible protein A, partial [Alphaproteobacteria bacterium]|nr:competence/damage-inducible protein A [Alphaproteobacteria bacterium]